MEERKWAHLSYDFLQPEKIRDAEKRRPDHPDYNPRTVFVPPSFLQSLTPVSISTVVYGTVYNCY